MEESIIKSEMKAEVFYFSKEAFEKSPHGSFFNDAKYTVELLDTTGLESFVKVGEYQSKSDKVNTKDALAEEVFMQYNAEWSNPLGTKEGQQKIRSLGVSHTSMSINDFVVIDGEVLIVDQYDFLNIGKHKAVSEVVA